MNTPRTIRLARTATTMVLDASTPALRGSKFCLLYRAAHGENAPTEVHTAAWAGPCDDDSREAHTALCSELAAAASTVGDAGSDGYILLRGEGCDGSDVWARYTAV